MEGTAKRAAQGAVRNGPGTWEVTTAGYGGKITHETITDEEKQRRDRESSKGAVTGIGSFVAETVPATVGVLGEKGKELVSSAGSTIYDDLFKLALVYVVIKALT